MNMKQIMTDKDTEKFNEHAFKLCQLMAKYMEAPQEEYVFSTYLPEKDEPSFKIKFKITSFQKLEETKK